MAASQVNGLLESGLSGAGRIRSSCGHGVGVSGFRVRHLQIKPARGPGPGPVEQVQVDHGGRHVRVPNEFLQGPAECRQTFLSAGPMARPCPGLTHERGVAHDHPRFPAVGNPVRGCRAQAGMPTPLWAPRRLIALELEWAQSAGRHSCLPCRTRFRITESG